MGTDSTNSIILFPDYQACKEKVDRLRTELSMLLLERDELEFVICKNIESAYYLKLGAIEYKAYETECAALRLKRMVDLVQARINRQEKVIIADIERVLDEEFAEYQRKLNRQIEKMNEALERSRSRILTDAEAEELKKLYRSIVKRLHPDVNPNVTQAQLRLLTNAISAYKNGDLAAMRIIAAMVAEPVLPDRAREAMHMLTEESRRLETMLSSVREQIADIKSRFPYTVKDIVEDPQKEQQRREEIESALAQYQGLIKKYKARLAEMLGKNDA